MVPGAGIEFIGELGHIRDLCGILLAFYADTPSLRSLTIVDFVESNQAQYPGIPPVSRSHLVRAALNSGITQPVQTRLKGLHTFKLLNFFARLRVHIIYSENQIDGVPALVAPEELCFVAWHFDPCCRIPVCAM